MYPLSDVHVREKSKVCLVDLYLNMQDGNERAMVKGLEVGEGREMWLLFCQSLIHWLAVDLLF